MSRDIQIFVEATDDTGITEVGIAFSKRGTPLDDIKLEQTGDSMFATTYSFSTYGTIHYVATVTDTKGQTDTEEGDIVVLLAGDGAGDGGGSGYVPPPPT